MSFDGVVARTGLVIDGAGVAAIVAGVVAADIIRTMAAKPTLTNVAVLAAIVLIRTFLSFSLELEITGRWPWQTRLASLRPGLGSPWTQPPSASGCG